ncbi:hypothetical protein LBYS11_16425 [Lysinibacillus sp. YS11]|uniref:YopX family protein n=1 Tax=Lysinibacillus sp. YS11 TaxID=2072025 RepID=UPI000CA1E7CE|nr:YopX family protein [Lysinibacillus sp. YS11]AUS87824.1 hypothetical protein LBYS11_16425 [Lysinibacillus sp. YS11]
MSREIKFRAWDSELKIMVYSNELYGHVEYNCNPVRAVNIILNEDDHGLQYMQYTGLKDANSKEIYEGDIVRVNKLTYETSGVLPENLLVKYYGGMFQFFRGENDCLMGLHLLYLDDGEVIGNIYEHKHLLGVTA